MLYENSKWRKEGFINKADRKRIPKRLLFFDTETYPKAIDEKINLNVLRLGVCIFVQLDGKGDITEIDKSIFFSIAEFFSILQSKLNVNEELYIFAHNIKFDLMVVNAPTELNNRRFISEPPIINERAFIWRTKSIKGLATFLDTANFAVQSVEQLGKDLGFPKMHVDFDNVTDADLITYCERDVVIIQKFVCEYIKFISTHELGEFKLTLASQSLTSWRTRFITQSIYIHSMPAYLNIERNSYHGGRVECFRLGQMSGDKFYYLDVNSMYPFVMRNMLLPYEITAFKAGCKPSLLSHFIDDKYIIAEVGIETDKPVYPVIRNSKLIFPVGRFYATLHHDELAYALYNGHIKSVRYAQFYSKAVLFDKYVDFFYDVKLSSKKANNASWYWISKIFLNSLYGKFGQTDTKRQVIGDCEKDALFRILTYAPELGLSGSEVMWFGKVYQEFKCGESTYSYPAIAGAITAYARMLLWRYIETAGTENVYYCDTDSIFVNEVGYNNVVMSIDDNRLGALGIKDVSDTLVLRGLKDYRFGSSDKTKGKSKSAKDITEDRWEQLQFEGFLSWLNTGGNRPPIIKTITKSRSGIYNKGTVDIATGFVYPFVLSEF